MRMRAIELPNDRYGIVFDGCSPDQLQTIFDLNAAFYKSEGKNMHTAYGAEFIHVSTDSLDIE